MKMIQEWLGHSNFATTANIYSHLDYSSKLTSADAILNGIGIKRQQKAPILAKNRCFFGLFWRREWDSNPRNLSVRRFSRPLPQTTRTSLQMLFEPTIRGDCLGRCIKNCQLITPQKPGNNSVLPGNHASFQKVVSFTLGVFYISPKFSSLDFGEMFRGDAAKIAHP